MRAAVLPPAIACSSCCTIVFASESLSRAWGRASRQKFAYVQRRWLNERVFARFAENLDARKLTQDWRPDSTTMDAFRAFLDREMPYTTADFDENQGFVKRFLTGRALTAAFDVDAGARAETEADPLVQSAAVRLDEAARLLDRRHNAVARAD